jgi:hypothetical protein
MRKMGRQRCTTYKILMVATIRERWEGNVAWHTRFSWWQQYEKDGKATLHDIQDTHGGNNPRLNFSMLQGHVYSNQRILKMKSVHFIDMLDLIYHLSEVRVLWCKVQKHEVRQGTGINYLVLSDTMLHSITLEKWPFGALRCQSRPQPHSLLHHTHWALYSTKQPSVKLTINLPSTGIRHECT